jgi:flagellar biosynthesis protein FlhF
MAQAMDMLRRELGEDAIIVSSETTEHGVKLVAAIEEADDELPSVGQVAVDTYGQASDEDPIDLIHEALMTHGLPNRLLERLIDASFLVGADDPLEALAGALGGTFNFRPLTIDRRVNQPLMLVGAPGAGKTVGVAKLAFRAVMAGRAVRLITTDTVRAGGIEQLDAFARLMKLPLETAETERQLVRLIEAAAPDDYILIDTPGVNPYAPRDMAEIQGLAKSIAVEPLLVIAGGGDVVDAMEQSYEFARLGVGRLLVTRLDMVRRLGSMLAAADAANVAFADYSMTPSVADGLNPLDPMGLARMLMPEPSAVTLTQSVSQGARL